MEKRCFLFSGQGSQYPGMGQELLENDSSLEVVFETGSRILGYDLKEACFTYTAEELARTEVSQPAILAVSLLAFESVKKKGILPDMVAGHSLGEYAAMVASGMLSLEDGFRVIKARAHAMGSCAEKHPGAMCAVMGMQPEEIAEFCDQVDGFVTPVNFNSLVQTVIAGETESVEQAVALFTEQGKKAVKLAVSAAFHTPLMQEAADEFQAAIADVPFRAPEVSFYSNTTGKELTDFSDMPGYLAKHLVSPVYFVKELQNLQAAGAGVFVECGPGKVLTGLVKRTLEGVSAQNVENVRGLEKLAL